MFAAALANGGSLSNITPGVDFFAKLAKAGKFQPINVTPQTVASGQTPVTLDWDYNQFGYKKTYTNFKWGVSIPKSGVYGGYYCQAINATAPHPWAARLWEEFLYSDFGQLLFLKGYAHPARFADLAARKVIPAALTKALPSPTLYAGVKFASLKQISDAKAIVAAQWGPRSSGPERDRGRDHRTAGPGRARPATAAARLARRRPVLRLFSRVPAAPVGGRPDRRLQGRAGLLHDEERL